MLKPSVRWLFAIAVIVCGVFVLLKAKSDTTTVAEGLGLLFAGIGLVVP